MNEDRRGTSTPFWRRFLPWKGTRPGTSSVNPVETVSEATIGATIDCSACRTSNPAEAKFCVGCGSALSSNCPTCGTERLPEARFCLNCGTQLAEIRADLDRARLQQYVPKELLSKLEAVQAGGGVQGERRVVTMLFCDVGGSTAAAENLDPEEWAEIINGAFNYLIAPVYRYEGTLARLMGDAILALFGAPIAHEDDPQRAVLAGLDIIQGIAPYREQVKTRWGLDFQVRVGINTGLVVVGEVGSDLRVEYTALGDAINLAARMEQSAKLGTVQISSDTYRLIEPLFEFEDLGGIEVKGKSEPIQAYRVLQPKTEPGSLRGIEGLDAPLVGRAHEMERLHGITRELRQGHGQIASVMGDAGLGKSRLVAELRHSLASESILRFAGATPNQSAGLPEDQRFGSAWYEGRSLSYETSTPCSPFVSLFTRYFGLRAEQTDAEKYSTIETHISELLPDRFEEIAPFIASMMGLTLTGEAEERIKYLQPPQVRDRIFRATCDLFSQLAQVRPLVLVFEDLHWVDPTSLDLVGQLMQLTDHVPIMLVGVFRPSRQEPSWRFHETSTTTYAHRYTSIALEPLNEDSSRELVAELLHVEDLPKKVRELILTKAEGNPFFVEEVIRSLLDAQLVVRDNSHWRATQEIENIALPDTLAGVITARLDRLQEETKRVAQTASVIGREFHFLTLKDVHDSSQSLDDSLNDLQHKELIREGTRLPEPVYVFKHTLTQETGYSSLLLSRRRELHRRVAECLEQIAPDRGGEISRHFLEAREEAHALPYLVDAGDRAARAYSTVEAIQSYTKALEILGEVKDQPLARRAYEGLGGALTFGGEVSGAVENYNMMFHDAQEYGDIPMQVSALNKLGFVTALVQGQFPQAEENLVDAERLALECNDLPGLAELHMTYCYLRVPFGLFDDAVDHLAESAKIGQDLQLEEPRLFGMTHIANTLMYMTKFDEAWQATQEARKLAEELGNRRWLAELKGLTSPLYYMRIGDLDSASREANEGADLAAQIGAVEQEADGSLMQGQVAWFRGEYELAITCGKRALESARASGMPFLEAAALSALGTAHLDIGGNYREQGSKFHTQALEVMENPLGSVMGSMIWADIGFCAMAMGEVERANDMFQKGLTESTAMKLLARPALLVGAAFLELGRGNGGEGAKLVQEAREFVEERQMKHSFPLIALAEGQASATEGDAATALEHLTRAEQLALEMRMRPMVLQARLGAAQVLDMAGRSDEAEVKRKEARAMIDEIGPLFEDDALRTNYLESAAGKLA